VDDRGSRELARALKDPHHAIRPRDPEHQGTAAIGPECELDPTVTQKGHARRVAERVEVILAVA
jgi:hypothetical protein